MSGGVIPFYLLTRRGGFSEGLVTSRRRHVIQGPDTSSRSLTGTGARHVTLLTPDRGTTPHVVTDYQGTMSFLWLSVDKVLPSQIHSVVPSPSERFFFLTDSPYSSRTPHTPTVGHLIHLRPGSSGVTGLMGSLNDLMSRNWGY